MLRPFAAALLALILFTHPVSAVVVSPTVAARCSALVSEVNKFRTARDLRVLTVLCKVGRDRAIQMANARAMWHDMRPVKRALNAAGICWRNVGEVLAWNTYSPTATEFVRQWRGSDPHWSLLSASRYERAGGSWTGAGGRFYAVMYVVDLC